MVTSVERQKGKIGCFVEIGLIGIILASMFIPYTNTWNVFDGFDAVRTTIGLVIVGKEIKNAFDRGDNSPPSISGMVG